MPDKQPYEEKQLLLRVAEGDEQAFSSLVRLYGPNIHAFLSKMLPESYAINEIANDIFLHLWLKRDSLTQIRNLEAYMFVLSRNHALNVIKKSLREKKRLERWYAEANQMDTDPLEHKALDLIDEALANLSPQQRHCWILSRRLGKSYNEIGQELNISRNTVKSHITAANSSMIDYVLKRLNISLAEAIFLCFFYFF